jgi:hypothetical protein
MAIDVAVIDMCAPVGERQAQLADSAPSALNIV